MGGSVGRLITITTFIKSASTILNSSCATKLQNLKLPPLYLMKKEFSALSRS
ncbi:MAG: hypothetical protein IJT73_06465 [Selenomonadaceae bacterium]|nr:hypothetical protein [Selenomonadaceae bacterium]